MRITSQLRAWALLGTALSACGGTSSADQDTNCPIPNHVGCAQPRGVYQTTYNERQGGTCGRREPIVGQVVKVRQTSFSAPCVGDIIWSSDFCTASFDVTCPEEELGPGFTNRQVSRTNYTEDGMIGIGVYELTVFDADGKVYCESTYDKHGLNASCD